MEQLAYHTLLHDFLTDSHRSQSFFANPAMHHTSILLNSSKLITAKTESLIEPPTMLVWAGNTACVTWGGSSSVVTVEEYYCGPDPEADSALTVL